MGSINGLRTVNGGTIVQYEGKQVELLGSKYSTHKKDIVAGYYRDGLVKVELCYSPDGVEVFRFKTANSLQHYWSRHYSLEEIKNSKGLYEKYWDKIEFLGGAYATYFWK